MTQLNITPQGFRTAAYLESKARMDAARSRTGKTRRRVTCTPPNVKCGGRCIPPNWDCRLKGKGPDSHLRAVRTDPISGLANIERGVKRISKGVRKGSFSEIEGGKRAIVRGVVKATPGDIQRKKKLQADLERRAGGIAAGLAVVGFGLFSHNQLKRAPFYRDGIGRQIDDAVAGGINRVLDAAPGISRARAERRAAGRSAAGEAVARATGEAARGPEAMRGAVLRTPTQLERRATEYGNAKVLENKIKALDIEAKELDMNASTWRQKNLETFWGATRTNAGGAGAGSTFSEPATNKYLSRQFGFKLKKGDDATTVRRSVATALNREARNLQALARQEGVNLKDANSRNAFLNRVVGPSTANFSGDVRERAVSNLDRIIGDAPRGGSTEVSRKQLADTLYRDTRAGFDQYFGRIADEVRQPVGAALSAAARKAGYSDLLTSARIGQSRYLAKSLNKPEAVGNKMSQGLSDLVAKEYYSSKVIGSPTFTATDREIRLAASELSGRSFSTTTPAVDYLRSNGFERLTTLRGSESRVRASTPSPERPTRAARRRSTAQRIADLMRQKNKDGTPRYATREAAEAALERMRKDELQQARIDAYLAVREDLRGKPCGASHIPKAHECTKAEGRTMDRERDGKKSLKGKQIATALAIGTVGAVAVAAANDAYQLSSGMGMGTTPSLRTAVKPFKSDTFSKTDPKGVQAALGNYYDSKVKAEGWKTGDLVFNRTKNEPTAHFAIYMGKKNGVHSFAQMAADGLVAKSGGIDITEAGQSAKRQFASGVVFERAPSGKQPKVKYSPTQIAARVEALKGKTLDYDVFNANCESWARMIVSGNSRSTQSARLSQVGKLAIRGVYKSLGEVVKWAPDYVPETVQGDRIYKVSKWLDRNNTRGNDSGYSAMVLRNKNLRKDSPESDAVGLIDPGNVIKPEMSDIEAISAAKRWLMVLSGVIANDPKS